MTFKISDTVDTPTGARDNDHMLRQPTRVTKADRPFWLVWRSGTQSVTFRHDRAVDAKAEAKRLAAKHPDESFYVLKATTEIVHRGIIETPLIEEQDIPY